MPKAFDEREKQEIGAALRRAALKQFERAGLRAARIDDICRDVGIAKGSFYAFFSSKEELFMAIVEEREEQHRQDMYGHIGAAKGSPADRAGGFFDLIMRKIEADPIINLVIVNNEIPHLVRKLGPERFAKSQIDDRAFAEEAARRWRKAGGQPIDAGDLLGLMTICLSVAVQRRQMTTEQYRPVVALLRELFIGRLAEKRK